MEQENKDLLLKYLCMALPYGVVIKITSDDGMLDVSYNIKLDADLLSDLLHSEDDFMPYLRPLSSITEEERVEISNFIKHDILKNPFGKINPKGMDNLLHSVIVSSSSLIKQLLEKHFDFMELASKDLAIEITKENNPYK